jgi:hypothetical protein
MKKTVLIVLLLSLCFAGRPQRFEVATCNTPATFKRHFSYSIEKGYRDGIGRQVVAGNQTDWLVNNKDIMGNAINNNVFSIGRAVRVTTDQENILMTDFVVAPETGNSEYAAGTGIYFPNGPTGYGYVFFAIYERASGTITNMVYYDLLYPGQDVPKNTTGTRIKYSSHENAYYISGIMVDRTFASMNFNNPVFKSIGFIMRIDPPYTMANVVEFPPDALADPKLALYSSVNDIEINTNQDAIAFTGVNTEADFTGNYQPMAGMIDMNLNVFWCNTYELTDLRYSGVDVVFGQNDQSVYALFNSEGRPFAITQLDLGGSVMQQPVEYAADIPICYNLGIPGLFPAYARGHTMHLTPANDLIVTGNGYITADGGDWYQRLFRYEITDANNLVAGNNTIDNFSCDLVPIGNQLMITSWWAPENSVYMDNNLYIVGSYNNNSPLTPEFGYNFINVNGFDFANRSCYAQGRVNITPVNAHYLHRPYDIVKTSAHDIGWLLYEWATDPHQDCPSHPGGEKSGTLINQDETAAGIWKYLGMDEGGIHAILTAETACRYQVSVFDITGKMVCSYENNVEGQKEIYLKFHPANQLYLIKVNNGARVETIKIPYIR